MSSASQASAIDRIGQTLSGRWRLESLLGVGGMGEVYRATHRNGSRVAIKVLHRHLAANTNLTARFLQEGYAANAVGHPGVVRVLDDDTTPDGLPFLVMELLDGEPLDVVVQRHGGRLPANDVLPMFDALLDVVGAAHQRQIVHRDIKPENIVRQPDGQIKVLDFGLARLRSGEPGDAPRTLAGRTMGTPGYMPPEQVLGNWSQVDARSDLWAVAATMHFCLTGRAAHDEGDLQRTMQRTMTLPVPSIRHLVPGLPPAVVELVDRGLAFDRHGRWASAQEMRAALQIAQAALALAALPPRSSPRAVPPTAVATGASREASLSPASGVSPSGALPPGGPRRPTPTDEFLSPIQIAEDTYWVGKRDPRSIFHANPYLRLFRDQTDAAQTFPLLIDPGSASDLAIVQSKVRTLLGPSGQLGAIFINHQDPDVGSSSPVLCARHSPQARILCSEATWRLIVHMGLPRDRFVDTEKYPRGFRLPTGHIALPVPSPFCHFRGAVMLYDPATRVLFTGDLFGGLTAEGASGIWADDSDWSGVRAFHQMYMPCQRAIAPVIARIRELTPAVEVIAPQHGRLLRGNVLHRFLGWLETLPVGLDLMEEEQSPDLIAAWNSVLHRVIGVAEMMLGHGVREALLASEALRDVLTVEDGHLSASAMGRWVVSAAVHELCQGQTPTITNPIKLEAILAAEQLDLPSPDLHIDDGEGVG